MVMGRSFVFGGVTSPKFAIAGLTQRSHGGSVITLAVSVMCVSGCVGSLE